MANIRSDIDKHAMMEQRYMVLGTPKNIITSDADNSMIQLITFEFYFVFTFSRSLMSLQ